MSIETTGAAQDTSATHSVFNQPPPLEGYDAVSADRALTDALVREGAGWAGSGCGRRFLAGRRRGDRLGLPGRRHRPVLRTHDRFGHRVDEVDFHPAYHELLGTSVRHGLHAAPWTDPRPGAHVARAARLRRLEPGGRRHRLPGVDDLRGGAGAARASPGSARGVGAAAGVPRATSRALVPAPTSAARSVGMAMTEKQGGSDVRANTTRAVRAGRRPVAPSTGSPVTSGSARRRCRTLSSCSRRPPSGLTCFLLPRVLPDGTRNAVRHPAAQGQARQPVERVGRDRARGAWARRVGEEGRGVPTIVEMVALTRLDCVLGSAGLACGRPWPRRLHHAAHRTAFGRRLAGRAADAGTCWPTSRWSPRRRPRWRCGSRAPSTDGATTTTHERRCAGSPPRSPSTGVCKRGAGDRGGAGVPGRQRVRRGVGDAAAVPRGAGELGLGGLGQRQRASTCCARPRTPPESPTPCFARSAWRGARDAAARRAAASACAATSARLGRTSSAGARAPRRADGARAAGQPARAPRPRRRDRTRSAPAAWPATAATPSARCRPGPTSRAILEINQAQ